ncbi:hypothetical protein GN244_ATG11406 [Phytophthora infestans]|uniref:Uncharacterized protein n=1 Tax=Phytophthora infestans TaxID=4787 RepID=A0A833W0E5_PHYIN|nr:hypothetical protein GN244_ATG11406 [Phytophthora infestans]
MELESTSSVLAANGLSETLDLESMNRERGVDYAALVVNDSHDIVHKQRDDHCEETAHASEKTLDQIEGITVQLPSVLETKDCEVNQQVVEPKLLSSSCKSEAPQKSDTTCEASDSVIGECGSLKDDEELEDEQDSSKNHDGEVEEGVTVASTISSMDEINHVE